MLAVDVRGLEKWYPSLGGRRVALAGVDLRVPLGASFGLIGPNGAGKTTFIKALLGVLRPTAGEIRLLGGSPEDPRVRARVGYLPERLGFPRGFSPRRVLASVARLKGVRPADAVARQLARVGLADHADVPVQKLSKGLRQRVGLAAALIGEPELLVLDEPTDGIDPIGRLEVRGILAEERARGATILLNSHLLAETERISERIGILHQGRLIAEGPLAELAESGRRVRIRLDPAGPSAQALVGVLGDGAAWAEVAPNELVGEVLDVHALNAAIDRVRGSGGLVLAVLPERRDLEEILRDALARPEGRR